MENEIKFRKGDKVIILELDYFQNQYHYKKCISELTVLDATELYFSPYYDPYDRFLSGSNQWSIFSQNTGIAVYGGQKLYHKEKDKNIIKKLIDEAIKKYDDYCKDNDDKRILALNNKITESQKEIEAINNGNGNWKSGFSTFNNKEFKEKVTNEIEKIFK